MKTKKVIVNVTAADIKHGQRMDCHSCPIARAVSRRLKPGYRLYMCRTYYYIERVHRSGGWRGERVTDWLATPKKAEEFVRLFDSCQQEERDKAKPCRITWELPEEFLL